MNEGDLKRCIDDLLQIEQNRGNLIYLRLNSGNFLVGAGETCRRVKGCPAGTSDFEIVKKRRERYRGCEVIFLELKSSKGKQSPEQVSFQKLVEEQGARYEVVRSVEEIIAILGIQLQDN